MRSRMLHLGHSFIIFATIFVTWNPSAEALPVRANFSILGEVFVLNSLAFGDFGFGMSLNGTTLATGTTS